MFAGFVEKLLLINFIKIHTIKNTSSTAITTGIINTNTDPEMAAAFSVVATIALPVPTVALLLNKRNKLVPSWIVPAAVPPANKPMPQRSVGSSVCMGKMEVASRVPAATDKGAAIVSSILSMKGM